MPTLLLIAICGLALSCAASSPRHAATESSARKPEHASGDAVPTIKVEVSPVMNLFHWIDHLAGTSFGKTTPAYRRHWIERNGRIVEGDRRALLAFRRARVEGTRSHAVGLPQQEQEGCLFDPYENLNARARLSIAAMESKNIEDLVSRSRTFLSAQAVDDLEYALRHFEAPWARIWEESKFLHGFRDKTEGFLQSPEVLDLTRRIVTYLGAELSARAPTYISLVALLEYGPTHAEANGDHLLIEIRPDDDPRDQVQVIYHELAHFLLRSLPESRRKALAGAFLSKGARGALTWNLLREALPTALGQGIAQHDLAPEGYSFRQRWYHLAGIDDLAHEIFPHVKESVGAGATLETSDIGSFIDAVDDQIYEASPLLHFLPEAVLISSESDAPWLQRWRAMQGGMNQRVVAIETLQRGLAPLLQTYECLPFVVFAPRENDSAYDLPPYLAAQVAEHLPLMQDGGTYVVPLRRKTGAPSLVVLLAESSTAGEVQRNLARIRGWPTHPLKVGAP